MLINLADWLCGRPSWQFTRAFFLGFDGNIPTWYSSVVLLAGAVAAHRCYTMSGQNELRPSYGWLMIAMVMLLMSLDETAQLHEHWGGYLSRKTSEYFPDQVEQVGYGGWALVLGPVLIVFAVFLALVMRRHVRGSRTSALAMLLGAILILGGGVVLEWLVRYTRYEEAETLWQVENLLEESGEMMGGWLIGYGALLRCRDIAEGRAR